VLRDFASGESLGEVVDDEVSVLDGARLVARFRELEVELEPDVPEGVAESIAMRLHTAGAGLPHLVPKVVRALGPRALEPPDVVTPPKPGADSSAAAIAHAAIVDSVVRLLAHDPGVRLGDDPEDVHQMRVATRRLRSDLRTFRPVVDRGWSDLLRDELEWLGGLLGGVRDTEVLLDRLDARIDGLAEVDRDAGKRLLDTLRDHRDDARVALLAGLRSQRFLALLDELVGATVALTLADVAVDTNVATNADTDGVTRSGDDIDLERLIRKPWRELRDAVDALDEEPPDPALHAVRKLAKRARYASEAIQPAVGRSAKDFARRAAALQDVLGEHQDAVVAEEWLREHASSGHERGAEYAFVAGQLVSLERLAADDARAQWWRAWKQLRRVRPSHWS
jgi:CHAD domain-containing protein